VVRELPALVSFPAPVLRLFSPPFFAASQAPSRTKASAFSKSTRYCAGFPRPPFLSCDVKTLTSQNRRRARFPGSLASSTAGGSARLSPL
jgi:hypothetical protein